MSSRLGKQPGDPHGEHRCDVDADHAIVGGGLSGLLLAQALLASSAPERRHPRVLIVDPRPPDDEPVTLAFWARHPTVLHPWEVATWDSLRLVDRHGLQTRVGLDAWRYTAVAWGRARDALYERLAADRRVTVSHDAVREIRDAESSATVVTGTAEATASWVYDSRPPTVPDLATDFGRSPASTEPALTQVFHGVWVHTHDQVLDPSAATLLDFTADTGPDLGFSYVLPISATSAMVMAVRMGEQPAEPDPLPTAARLAGGSEWSVEAVERGSTPLVGRRPTRATGRRVMAIGIRGGRVRPSTGYAVVRILDDTAAIARSLHANGHPFDVPPDPRWQARLDTIWLRALAEERSALGPAFLALFTSAGVDSVLRFLDGEARRRDVAAVVRALPPGPFVRAALRRDGDARHS